MKSLATSFGKVRTEIRSNIALLDDQIRSVAPSIYAEDKHVSRSARYTYVPTCDILAGLRKEGFQPFFACQSRSRIPGKSEFTKHMLRLRKADSITSGEANEIILINSHDGTSAYQMLAGCFVFVCANGLVSGDKVSDVRIPHKGDIVHEVIGSAYTVLDGLNIYTEQRREMKDIELSGPEQALFAREAIGLKYEPTEQSIDDVNFVPVPPPLTTEQVLRPRRWEDSNASLWSTFNRVQENLVDGGLQTRSASNRRMTTRPVTGIDQNIRLNRALSSLAEGMAALKR